MLVVGTLVGALVGALVGGLVGGLMARLVQLPGQEISSISISWKQSSAVIVLNNSIFLQNLVCNDVFSMVLSAPAVRLLLLLLHFFSMYSMKAKGCWGKALIVPSGFPIKTSFVGFSGVPTMVMVVVASMGVNTSSVKTNPMRVKLGMVNVCVILFFLECFCL